MAKTPEPGAWPPARRFPGPPRRLMAGAVVPGAGEEAMVGGEEGAKGEEMASVRLLVVCFGRGGKGGGCGGCEGEGAGRQFEADEQLLRHIDVGAGAAARVAR